MASRDVRILVIWSSHDSPGRRLVYVAWVIRRDRLSAQIAEIRAAGHVVDIPFE